MFFKRLVITPLLLGLLVNALGAEPCLLFQPNQNSCGVGMPTGTLESALQVSPVSACGFAIVGKSVSAWTQRLLTVSQDHLEISVWVFAATGIVALAVAFASRMTNAEFRKTYKLNLRFHGSDVITTAKHVIPLFIAFVTVVTITYFSDRSKSNSEIYKIIGQIVIWPVYLLAIWGILALAGLIIMLIVKPVAFAIWQTLFYRSPEQKRPPAPPVNIKPPNRRAGIIKIGTTLGIVGLTTAAAAVVHFLPSTLAHIMSITGWDWETIEILGIGTLLVVAVAAVIAWQIWFGKNVSEIWRRSERVEGAQNYVNYLDDDSNSPEDYAAAKRAATDIFLLLKPIVGEKRSKQALSTILRMTPRNITSTDHELVMHDLGNEFSRIYTSYPRTSSLLSVVAVLRSDVVGKNLLPFSIDGFPSELLARSGIVVVPDRPINKSAA